MALSVFNSVNELEKQLKGSRSKINDKIWDLLLK